MESATNTEQYVSDNLDLDGDFRRIKKLGCSTSFQT